MRKEFEMTQEQLDALYTAMQAVPYVDFGAGFSNSQQENANAAWNVLGQAMGFVGSTAEPCGKGERFFTAEEVG